MKYFIKNN